LGVFIVSLLVGAYWLAKPVLLVQEGPESGDVIVLLTGEPGERTFKALELYKSGAASRILVSGTGQELYAERLVLAGVPKEAITVEPRSRNTKENAEFSIPLLKREGCKRVLLVTSWYHSRRALACFRHFGGDLEISSCPACEEMKWRKRPEAIETLQVWREYAALGWYWIHHGVGLTEHEKVVETQQAKLKGKP